MISMEEAIKILNQVPVKPQTEKIDLDHVLGRILAQDIISGIDMPPFNKSAMDGYAVISSDSSENFKIVETIPAGEVPQRQIRHGECAKVMTGGIVPEPADKVIRRELTTEKNGYMKVTGAETNANVCIAGEDIKKGDNVLEKGKRINPQETGIIASMGMNEVDVYTRPKAGILSTGSEIVSPGKKIEAGQIYDSNSYSLSSQVKQMGAEICLRKMVTDNPNQIEKSIKNFLNLCDILLISGGVSAGDFDYVPAILKKLGFKLHFEQVAIKPGKPIVFGTRDEKFVFGVPGNPVSTFVVFEVFIKSFIYRMMGHVFEPFMISSVLHETIHRKKTGRSSFIPVEYKGGGIRRLDYHGSAHIHALTRADALLCMPKGVKELPEGSQVYVRRI